MIHWERIAWYITDTFIPPNEEHSVVRNLDSLAGFLSVHTAGEATALMRFSDDTVRAVIHEAKFSGNAKAHHLLGEVLAAYVSAKQKERTVFIIPVPLHAFRFRARGCNQVSETVRYAMKYNSHIILANGLLARRVHTDPQTDLGRKERKKNVRGAFSARFFPRVPDGIDASDTHCILLDDVATTGATLQEARKTLEEAFHIKPECLVFAH